MSRAGLTAREKAAARLMVGVGILTGATFVLVARWLGIPDAGAAVLVPGVILVADGSRSLRGK